MKRIDETLFNALSMDQELCDLLSNHIDQIFTETENSLNFQKKEQPRRVNHLLRLKREFRQKNAFNNDLNGELRHGN